MVKFKFKITEACGYSYEYIVSANEKLDAFAKINMYIKEKYKNPDLVKYEKLD